MIAWRHLPLLLLAFATQEGTPQEEALPPPPPRQAIAGLTGLRTMSRVEDLVRKQTFELEVVHVFPDRCRVRREKPGTRNQDFEYRSGGEVFLLPAATLQSRREPVERADSVLLRMELHRALFLWPDGFDWSPAKDGERRATVHRSAAVPESPVLGTLTARLDGAGLPRWLAAVDAAGAPAETYEVVSRSEDGRKWPEELRLSLHGEVVWNESVQVASVAVKRNDFAFLPYDRRPQPAPGLVAMDLQAFTYRRVELEADLDWPAAVARYAELFRSNREELEAAGYALDPAPTFEVGAGGRPKTCLLRLEEAATRPPAGWITRPERSGLAWRRLPTLAEVTPERIEALLRAVPEDSRGETPYLRQISYGRLTWVDVYLPLALR